MTACDGPWGHRRSIFILLLSLSTLCMQPIHLVPLQQIHLFLQMEVHQFQPMQPFLLLEYLNLSMVWYGVW